MKRDSESLWQRALTTINGSQKVHSMKTSILLQGIIYP